MIDKRLQRIGKPVLKRLERDHKHGQKRITMLFSKLRKHPASYKPGFKPNGSGMKMPKGVTKQAAGVFGLLTKKAKVLRKLYGVAKGKIVDHVRKHGTAIAKDVGKAAAGMIAKRVQRIIRSSKEKVKSHADSYKKRAGAHIDAAEDRVGKLIGRYLIGSGVTRAAVRMFKK